MDHATTQQYTLEDKTIRYMDNGREFHLWVIGLTPLTLVRVPSLNN